MRKLCQHCRHRLSYRPGRLCRACHSDRATRSLYLTSLAIQPPPRPFLLPLARYPDKSKLPRCPHGRRDGECPDCERAQRATVERTVPCE